MIVLAGMFGSWQNIDEFTGDIANLVQGYPTGDPFVTVEQCVERLENDLDSDATVYWVLGAVAVGPWLAWCGERPEVARRREDALAAALAVFRGRADSCPHDMHPWDEGPFVIPDDLTTFMHELQEADDWTPDPDDPDDEPPYDPEYAPLLRCPRNLAMVVENPDGA